ncbi:MAG: hypothetical protein VX509_03225 [Verrucomicrobiota bacterium]|nr:hypothetical protein [Verrucomicrobiota bacterium]
MKEKSGMERKARAMELDQPSREFYEVLMRRRELLKLRPTEGDPRLIFRDPD